MAVAIEDLKHHSTGKVREIYELEDDLLMVASDRISVYDVVPADADLRQGEGAQRMSIFWFELTGDIVPNHFISEDVPEEVTDRAMRVQRLEMLSGRVRGAGLPLRVGVEGVQAARLVCGIELPEGLQESEKLPEPIFTPTTKADVGHDEAINFDQAVDLVGDRR